MNKRELLYSGKAKAIYATDNCEQVIIHYTDAATAGNGAKRDTIADKGILNNQISTILFTVLKQAGIPTHHLETLDAREQLCRKVRVMPLEVITRNVIAGSLAERLGLAEGSVPEHVIHELCYKKDALGDPLINDDHAVALKAANYEELKLIYTLTGRINEILVPLFAAIDIRLVDFKIEFGKTVDGEIILADEISPDTCRLWEIKSGEKLDKDRFRRDLGGMTAAYREVLRRLENRSEYR